MSELKTNLQSILQEKTTKIIPQNIKKDVEVLDITGSYDKEDIHELEAELADAQNELATVRRDLENSAATVTGTGENVTLNQTAEATLKKLGVGGNTKQIQTTQSANLFDEDYYKNATYETYGQIGFTTLRIKGGRYLVFKSNLKEGKSAVSGLYMYISDIPHNTTSEIIYAISNGNAITRSKTFTATDLYLNIIGNVSDAFENYNIMIATSDIAYTPFVPNSPSPDYPQEITNVTGDVEVVVESANIWDEEWELGGLTSTGATITGTDRIRSKNYINVKPNQSCYCKSPNTMGVRFYNENKEFVSSVNGTNTTITIPANVYFMKFMVLNTTNYKNDICINVSNPSINGTYIPHKEQTFIFPLGNEKLMLGDYLADDGIHHVRGQKKYMGTEGWWEYSSLALDNTRVFALTNNIAPKNSNCLSNYFNTSITGWGNLTQIDKEVLQIYSDKTVYIRISKDRANNLTDFKTWLSTHNTTVEYELEEVIVPYTSTQQLVYNSIKKALSYDEQTNVSGISSGASPRFDIIALRNMNDTLNTLENEIELLP